MSAENSQFNSSNLATTSHDDLPTIRKGAYSHTMSFMSQSSFANNVLLLFESGLREKQRELAHAIESCQKEIRALADSGPGDVIDDYSAGASKENMLASYSRNRILLRKVELALKRISTGDFGICVTCGDAIGLKRLHAVPWASNCIECQQRSEQAVN